MLSVSQLFMIDGDHARWPKVRPPRPRHHARSASAPPHSELMAVTDYLAALLRLRFPSFPGNHMSIRNATAARIAGTSGRSRGFLVMDSPRSWVSCSAFDGAWPSLQIDTGAAQPAVSGVG